jgi:hypothetical protein
MNYSDISTMSINYSSPNGNYYYRDWFGSPILPNSNDGEHFDFHQLITTYFFPISR